MLKLRIRLFRVFLALFIIILLSFPLWGNNSVANISELSVGEKASNFTLINLSNYELFSLSDYIGKVILLDLFTMSCVPHTTAIPYISEIAGSFYDLIVISVDVDTEEGENQVQDFMNYHSIFWKVALDNNGTVASTYGTGLLPSIYIINQTGFIEYRKRIGFDYEEVFLVLFSLLSPGNDTTKPEIINAQIEPVAAPISIFSNQILITCDNVSDNFALKAVFAEIASPGIEIMEYPLIQTSNGSINQIIEIDPKQLYQQSTVQITVVAVDYGKNKQKSSPKEVNVEMTDTDNENPSIVSIEVNYTLIDHRYHFTVKTQVTDDLLVYKITVCFRCGGWQFCLKDMKRIPNEEDLFARTKIIHEDYITDPEDVWVAVWAEDLIGNTDIDDNLSYGNSEGFRVAIFSFLVILLFIIYLTVVVFSILFVYSSIKEKSKP
ncbi:MAG: TlpA family protein disulfide reductase [Candidatus Hodarchaeota archaeon]